MDNIIIESLLFISLLSVSPNILFKEKMILYKWKYLLLIITKQMENKNILISLAKSILHPKKGLAYIEGENLKSFEDWQMYLENRKCLVLLNIEKKYINFFTNYKIGEVIPSGIHNLDIYNAGFCCRVISDFFEGKTKKKII